MSSGSSLTSKLYDKIIKMLSKSHETIPLSPFSYLYVAATVDDVIRLKIIQDDRSVQPSCCLHTKSKVETKNFSAVVIKYRPISA
jgi:hypothetical protein